MAMILEVISQKNIRAITTFILRFINNCYAGYDVIKLRISYSGNEVRYRF